LARGRSGLSADLRAISYRDFKNTVRTGVRAFFCGRFGRNGRSEGSGLIGDGATGGGSCSCGFASRWRTLSASACQPAAIWTRARRSLSDNSANLRHFAALFWYSAIRFMWFR
jgi:hypothetical protein